ncbi:MAG: TFIIB-type zinc ribbon-containing protein [Clostridia bacterium]|nr:TFIIB-type zinc ribbon-containing protein [Clostridia bacterium]
MSSTVMFKCPCCGGYLEFDASLQKFKCLYCGQVLSEDDLREQSEQREAEADARSAEETRGEHSASGGLKSYHCQMCGAEIVTDSTTAATRCYYCHSPVVLHDRLDDDFRPDGVIPFALDREAAKKAFMDYVGGKKFIDKSFYDEGQLEMFSGVYYPWWYFDVEMDVRFEGQGTRRSVSTTPSYIITKTKYYSVVRQAQMAFRNVARKALSKMDGKLSDGIHPYDASGVKPYASGYLSGFLAETRDLERASVQDSVVAEVNGYAGQYMRSGHTFNSLDGQTDADVKKTDSRYVLLPAWVLTWKGGKEGKTYYYMMNGQTGKICGRLPINRTKLWSLALGAGLVVFALLCAGGKFIW